MHSIWYGLALVAAAAFVLAGCATTHEPNKAPKHPEEYVVPPEQDARFSQPPNYPKNSLNLDRVPVIADGSQLGQPGNGGGAGRNAGSGR